MRTASWASVPAAKNFSGVQSSSKLKPELLHASCKSFAQRRSCAVIAADRSSILPQPIPPATTQLSRANWASVVQIVQIGPQTEATNGPTARQQTARQLTGRQLGQLFGGQSESRRVVNSGTVDVHESTLDESKKTTLSLSRRRQYLSRRKKCPSEKQKKTRY